jgi:glycosyltransferase involved in cell wall biosynthesis
MRILHVSTYGGGDGAAIAAYRLHRGLLSLGCDSAMFVSQTPNGLEDPSVKVYKPPRDWRILRRRWRRLQIARGLPRYEASRPQGGETFSDDRSHHGDELVAQVPPCDIIHVHAMHAFIDYRSFFAAAPRRAPIVMTMHDMSFFTGGCHFDGVFTDGDHFHGGCGRYTERCGACPQLGSDQERDLSRQIWERKQKAFNSIAPGRLHLVAPCNWMAQEAKRSPLLQGRPVTVIRYGVDTEVFQPFDRAAARQVLGIPFNASVVLFVAQPLSRRNKGFRELAQALEGIRQSDLLLMSVGGGTPPVDVSVSHRRLGSVRDERLLAIAYNAADIFVIPSLQDNSPQTALEAIACGIPVLGFQTSGIPEIVRPGVTGMLVPLQDVAALRTTIIKLLGDPDERASMAARCRRVALEEYSPPSQTQHYVDLYRAVLAGAA